MGLTPEQIAFLYPITSVTVHRGGNLTINRSPRFKGNAPTPKRNEGDITKLSKKSLRRLQHTMNCTTVKFNSMITLTYGRYYPMSGKQVKQDLQIVIRMAQRWEKDYLWFLEFQERGAPHVHLLTTVEAITPTMRVELVYRWVGNMTKQAYFLAQCPVDKYPEELFKLLKVNSHPTVWELIRDSNGAAKYVSKYTSKQGQKTVPQDFRDVGRFWGCSRDVGQIEGVTVDLTEAEVRQLLTDHNHPAKDWEYMPKFVWGVNNDQ